MVVALLALSPYLLPAPSVLQVAAARPAVDGELSDVVSSVYAPDGRRRYRTESARVRHSHDSDVLTLEPLVMQYYSGAAQMMSLKSESGRVLEGGELVELDGAVELNRAAAGGHPRETVNTRNVKVRPEQWTAVTQEKVTLRRTGRTMTGRGMVADLRKGEISLLNEVRVRHEP